MIRNEMLERLDELMTYARCQNISSQRFHDMWQSLRDELIAEHCGSCEHWTLATKVSNKPINPGVCRGWIEGMFSISAEPENDEVFKTYEDFYCSCFKPKQAQETK